MGVLKNRMWKGLFGRLIRVGVPEAHAIALATVNYPSPAALSDLPRGPLISTRQINAITETFLRYPTEDHFDGIFLEIFGMLPGSYFEPGLGVGDVMSGRISMSEWLDADADAEEGNEHP